jgi:hypothetical protein
VYSLIKDKKRQYTIMESQSLPSPAASVDSIDKALRLIDSCNTKMATGSFNDSIVDSLDDSGTKKPAEVERRRSENQMTNDHQKAANNEDEDQSRPRRLSFEADANGMATLANQSEETTAISIQKKRKLSIPGTTTARQAKKPLSQTKIKINCRVFT